MKSCKIISIFLFLFLLQSAAVSFGMYFNEESMFAEKREFLEQKGKEDDSQNEDWFSCFDGGGDETPFAYPIDKVVRTLFVDKRYEVTLYESNKLTVFDHEDEAGLFHLNLDFSIDKIDELKLNMQSHHLLLTLNDGAIHIFDSGFEIFRRNHGSEKIVDFVVNQESHIILYAEKNMYFFNMKGKALFGQVKGNIKDFRIHEGYIALQTDDKVYMYDFERDQLLFTLPTLVGVTFQTPYTNMFTFAMVDFTTKRFYLYNDGVIVESYNDAFMQLPIDDLFYFNFNDNTIKVFSLTGQELLSIESCVQAVNVSRQQNVITITFADETIKNFDLRNARIKKYSKLIRTQVLHVYNGGSSEEKRFKLDIKKAQYTICGSTIIEKEEAQIRVGDYVFYDPCINRIVRVEKEATDFSKKSGKKRNPSIRGKNPLLRISGKKRKRSFRDATSNRQKKKRKLIL